jgi:hypothetical protein
MRAGTQERPVWDHTANGHGLTGTGGHRYHHPLGNPATARHRPNECRLSAEMEFPRVNKSTITLPQGRTDARQTRGWPLFRRCLKRLPRVAPSRRLAHVPAGLTACR